MAFSNCDGVSICFGRTRHLITLQHDYHFALMARSPRKIFLFQVRQKSGTYLAIGSGKLFSDAWWWPSRALPPCRPQTLPPSASYLAFWEPGHAGEN